MEEYTQGPRCLPIFPNTRKAMHVLPSYLWGENQLQLRSHSLPCVTPLLGRSRTDLPLFPPKQGLHFVRLLLCHRDGLSSFQHPPRWRLYSLQPGHPTGPTLSSRPISSLCPDGRRGVLLVSRYVTAAALPCPRLMPKAIADVRHPITRGAKAEREGPGAPRDGG